MDSKDSLKLKIYARMMLRAKFRTDIGFESLSETLTHI